MEIKALNENKTVKNIYVKNNDEWIKFEGSGNKFELPLNIKFSNSTSEIIDCTNLNTSNMIDMSSMFDTCSNLKEIINLDTSNVENFDHIFNKCTKLERINGDIVLTKAKKIPYFFNDCSSLIDVHITNIGVNPTLSGVSRNNYFDLKPCSKLNKESILYLINNAYNRANAGYSTLTISLNSKVFSLLSENEISDALKKGFVIET